MNIQLLKYFIEIVNTRSLSAAARNLFVTQPTLSLALKKMESELGTALFDHSDQPFQLTDTGVYLYEHGQEVVFQFDQLVTDIREMNQKPVKKQLRLGLTTLFAVQFMKEISRFLTTHPHVNLILQQDGSPKLQTMLANKEIDMGLISFPNTLPEIIHIEPLETTTKGYHVYVVAPESNPLSQYEKLTFKDLKDQRFSSLSDNFMIGRLLLDRTRSFGYEPNIILHNDDLQVLLYSLQKNNSIYLLPIEYYEVGKSQGLKWIPLKDKFDYFPIGIALRRDFSMTEDVRDFIQIIKEN
ncbi:TPA: LysR family transcriptional regulator [Enterococcus faecalis]